MENELPTGKQTEAPQTEGGASGATKKAATKKAPAKKPETKKAASKPKAKDISSEVIQLSVTQITVEKGRNPRQFYDREALKKLSISLKHVGMIQPLVVRTKPDDKKHYLVTGERRYRAAKLIKMTSVPVIVRPLMTDAQVVYAQHAENAHREDLNPIEYAQSIANFIGQEVEMTDKKSKKTKVITANAKVAAETYGLSQGSVSQYLALLNLPKPIQEAVRAGKVTFAQARIICSAKNTDDQMALYKKVMSGEAKRASDVKDAAEKGRAKKATKKGKKRGRPAQTDEAAPSVRQGLDTALERLRAAKMTSRKTGEVREGLAVTYERHERAKSDEKKQYYKGLAAGLEWAAGFRDNL